MAFSHLAHHYELHNNPAVKAVATIGQMVADAACDEKMDGMLFPVSFLADVRCKTNNNILVFYPFCPRCNDSFVSCFAFVLCIMTSAVPFYMDHKPFMESYEKMRISRDPSYVNFLSHKKTSCTTIRLQYFNLSAHLSSLLLRCWIAIKAALIPPPTTSSFN